MMGKTKIMPKKKMHPIQKKKREREKEQDVYLGF